MAIYNHENRTGVSNDFIRFCNYRFISKLNKIVCKIKELLRFGKDY